MARISASRERRADDGDGAGVEDRADDGGVGVVVDDHARDAGPAGVEQGDARRGLVHVERGGVEDRERGRRAVAERRLRCRGDAVDAVDAASRQHPFHVRKSRRFRADEDDVLPAHVRSPSSIMNPTAQRNAPSTLHLFSGRGGFALPELLAGTA